MKKFTKKKWARLAAEYAREAHEVNFESRRGWFPLDCGNGHCVLVLYNNNPYARDPQLRDRETDALRVWLKDQGISELAYATFPVFGEEAGYSYAMILDAPERRHAEVKSKVRELVDISQSGGHDVPPVLHLVRDGAP